MNDCFKITDDRFYAERTDLYDLIFEIQFSRLRFMVRNGEQLLWLEDHFLGNSNDIAACLAKCSGLIEQHAFLGIRFWKSVRLVSSLQIHTLVPASVFESSKAETYLGLTHPTASFADFEVSTEPVLNQQVVTGTLRQVNRFFRDRYPALVLVSSVAEGAKHFSLLGPDQTLGLISDSFIDLIYLKGKNRTLTAEKSPARHLRNIRAFTPALVLFGEITPFSVSYGILKDKFQTICIGDAPRQAGFSEPFQNIPAHRYFTLLHS